MYAQNIKVNALFAGFPCHYNRNYYWKSKSVIILQNKGNLECILGTLLNLKLLE